MNDSLARIHDWPELARQARWSTTALARQCGVSARTLHRFFLKHMGKSPRAWLAEQRYQHAHRLLGEGYSVKEVAANVGYLHQTNFTRQYKNLCGTSPSLRPLGMTPAAKSATGGK